MASLWNYLNSPQLVYKVQNCFGVERAGGNKKSDDGNSDKDLFKVKNKFFYYIFIIGTELGDALFYGIFIPFCFFNLDGFIARRFVFNWFINMYVGQALKEFFVEERPKFPAIQMQNKWSNEYSLPSTHAMSSPSIAITIVYFALERYEVNLAVCALLTVIWISVVSWSRVYLGMHSVLDLLMGFAISSVLLVLLLPVTNSIELFLAKSPTAPLVLLSTTVIFMIYFPRPSTGLWTPTKGDTMSIAGVFAGIEIGQWMNYQLGYLDDSGVSLPLVIAFSGWIALCGRTVIGLALVAATEFIGKPAIYSSLCFIYGEDRRALKKSPDSIDNRRKNAIDLITTFITYGILGFNSLFIAPLVFKYLGIQRDSFYTEI